MRNGADLMLKSDLLSSRLAQSLGRSILAGRVPSANARADILESVWLLRKGQS